MSPTMPPAPAFSDLVIDRYLADELPAAERAAFEERCAREPLLQARVDELRASRRAFSTAAPSFAAIAARASERAPWWQRVAHNLQARVALGALATAALLVVVTTTTDDDGDTRTKGGRFVDFVVERDGAVSAAAPGATLHPGDRVQFVVDAGADAYVGVWSIDGAGTLSHYAPTDGALERAHGAHRFNNSTRLDDVLGDEVFIGVRCAQDVPAALLEDALRSDAAPAGCAFDRVRVHKRARAEAP